MGDTARRLRLDADPEAVEKGLVTLVLTLVELLRQLMERQALRRVEQGSLTDDQIEKIGSTLMALDTRMAELRDHFGLSAEDLNLDLGPLGPLLPRLRSSVLRRPGAAVRRPGPVRRQAARSRGSPDDGQRRPSVQYRSMLSSRRPLVSGTKRQMNKMASAAKMA
jgi:hypothetical protein